VFRIRLKGIEEFREKIPKFSGKKIIFFVFYVIFIILSSFTILIALDLGPLLIGERLGYFRPWFPVIGVGIFELIGLILVYQMWFWRKRLKVKYGHLAYQKVFLAGFAGILILIVLSFHSFVPFYTLNSHFWSTGVYSLFTITFTSYFPPISFIIDIIRLTFGAIISILAILMMFRSLITLGFDYMTVIYLYFPEESSIQESRIYSVIRHPMYSGLILLSAGGFILHFNLYSAFFFVIYYLGFLIHIFLVEEKELLERFGASFIEYRRKVPVVFPYPTRWGKYFRFLLGKKD
jgi:protein-S-isoprenylcysteine O-methyltransferase Ste14